ncbi:brain-enriched guanylate kinase-associated protein-like [Carassius auratus]|uniref:Brain-enriched guanylate kinase-associated protein-like n=1 Tax=Carassius auratus TaxID=7957 RepID=A0A6P6PFY5_CARAU|nr:brain-enriched guanylate kinase-associated protein-like [Carassius auratus]
MKKIYIGRTALRASRNGCRHQKRSWLQEQKEDLRRRLGCTTHKLQQLRSESEDTRQYLETELRRAQQQLDRFTEKLRRIQSSYAALQRINQDMEEKIHRMTQHHDEEKRSLSREIVTLKNHLMEDKITIQKLREDNDLYRKDCNLAAQLLQCGKSPYRAHKLSELPADLQERVSSHMEQQSHGWHHSFSDAVPTAVIGRVLEKPEPGRSCPVTRSPSPQAPVFPSGTDNRVQRHTVYKSSDLSCSDTALYCPSDERRSDRWPERRQSADQSRRIPRHTSTDGNLDDESFHLHGDPFHGFILGSLPASSRYSSCSTASDEKDHASSSSQQALFADWCDGDYVFKNLSSYGKECPGFPKSSSSQHVGSQNGRSGDRRFHVPADTPERWRQMSMEDISSFSPFSFPERYFTVGPAKTKADPLYSSFQEEDNIFQRRAPDPRFPASEGSSPALYPKMSLNPLKTERGLMFHSKGSTSSFFITGNNKNKENTTKDALQRDYADESPGSSAESLNHGLDVQKYKDLKNPGAQRITPQHQKFGNAGLSRKNSLTKAQLYGTLLN